MTISLSPAARELLDGVTPAVLATLNPDGAPQMSVVWVGRDGDDLLISTTDGLRKVQNLRRDPRAGVTVIDAADPERYLEVRGVAEVTEDVGRKLAHDLAEHYEGPGSGQEYVELPPDVVRVVVRITPTRIHDRTA